MKRVLIAGATSAIAHAAARRFAGEGATLMLAARDPRIPRVSTTIPGWSRSLTMPSSRTSPSPRGCTSTT